MDETSEAPTKSCLNCPSYLSAREASHHFPKSIGAPMCAKFGFPLGKPNSTTNQLKLIAEMRGTACASHGQPRPRTPERYSLEVAVPNFDLRDKPKVDMPVPSCGGCSNFVRDEEVHEVWGFSAGLCRAKGRLILNSRRSEEAKGCEYANYGQPGVVRDVQRMKLFPEYEDSFGEINVVDEYFKEQENFVDPWDRKPDKPASDADKKLGIRGWQEIKDKEGSGHSVFIPLFDPNFFSATERAKIPRTGDDEHPELYVDHGNYTYKVAVLWMELDETPACWGPAGTGKTEFMRSMAWLMCLPFERLSITNSTELEDLAGKMHFSKDKGTYFEYGRLPKAWMKPNVICLDEPNVGPPDVWQFIRPLTDNSKQLVLDQNSGERIQRHFSCYMGLAMNPAWDVRNVGAEMIGDADGSRLMHISFELPAEPLEREIIRNRVKIDGWNIKDDQLDVVMNVARDVRALCAQGTLPITWGIRPQIKVARAMRWFAPVTAYRMASADYLDPEAQEALLTVVRSYVDNEKAMY